MQDPLLNQPGAGQGAASYKIFNPADLYMEDVDPELVSIVPKSRALSWMLHLGDRVGSRKTNRHVWSYYQEGQHLNTAATITGTPTVSGSKVTVQLSSADHFEQGGVSGSGSYPVKGMLVICQDGITQGYVESVDKSTAGQHKVVIKPTDSGMNLVTQCVAGRTLVFYSNAQKERSTGTTSRIPSFEKVTHKMHVIRDKFEVTDFEEQNASWFEVNGVQHIWYKGLIDTFDRWEDQLDKATLLGPDSVNLTDADNEPVQTMLGMIPMIRKYGSTMTYYDQVTSSDFDEIMLQLDHAYGDTEYMVLEGHNAQIGRKNWLLEFAKAGTGGFEFDAFDGADEHWVKVNCQKVQINNYKFAFHKLNTFSNRDGLGAANLPFRHMQIFLPLGYGKDPDPRGDGKMKPYFMHVYSNPGGNPSEHYGDDRRGGTYKMFETGANAMKGATNDEMVREIHMIKYCSQEFRNRNKFLLNELD